MRPRMFRGRFRIRTRWHPSCIVVCDLSIRPFQEIPMPILSQPAFGPKLAIGFITGGTLIDVWALVWRYTIAPSTLSANQQFWYSGLLLTGLTFLVIGAFLGSIGRAARKAELPPTDETTQAEAAIQNQA